MINTTLWLKVYSHFSFYEARGYRLEWTQEQYPATGCKYFMTKRL
ncbi:hypothetical protein [Shewanella sp. cp20]|nr:hypothetical protein [Shewanella sp. cp20]